MPANACGPRFEESLRIVGGAAENHTAVVGTFCLDARRYGLNQLRYDLRKLKGHGLLERDGKHYAYRLTDKGVKVAILFVLFHQHLCGRLANSLFHRRPDATLQPKSRLEPPLTGPMRQSHTWIKLLEAA